MSVYTQEQVNYLVEGKLDWETTMRMLSMPKDDDRFRMYLHTLQSKVPWDDKIILPISLHLYIAQNKTSKEWVTKCSCQLCRVVSDPTIREVHLPGMWSAVHYGPDGKKPGRHYLSSRYQLILVVTDNPREGKRLVTTFRASRPMLEMAKAA